MFSVCDLVENMNSNQDNVPTVEVGEANFHSEVMKSKQPVLVVFWAPWSRPCQIFDSVVAEVATACTGSVKVVKVNADNNPDLSLWYEIQSIPTLLYFVEGNLCARIVGTASKEAILSKLQSVFHGGDSTSFTPGGNKENEHRNL
jgi:thioredoxin